MLHFVLGMSLVLAPLLARFKGRPRHTLLAVSCALVAAGHMLTRAWFPHYSAPLVVPLVVLALLGLRRLAAWRRPVGRAAPWAVAAVYLVLFAVELPAHRPDENAWNVERQRIEDELRALPGRDLVIVHPPGDWNSNGADVDAADVVWARPVHATADRRLLEYYRDRRVWDLDLSRPGEPTPVPYAEPEGVVP